MKKFLIGLVCGIGLTASVGAYASDAVQAVLFPVTYEFNGVEQELGREYVTLNYKGSAYVPVRFVAEHLGAGARYLEEDRRISIAVEPSAAQSVERSMWASQYRMQVGMSDAEVKVLMGEPSAVYMTPEQNTLWRYDIGAKKGYLFNGMEADITGLEQGDVEAQLFVVWTDEGTLETFSLIYARTYESKRNVYVYIVFPDGHMLEALME